jgi:putative phosphatase
LRHFAKSYSIDYLVSTKLEFKNGVFTSKIAGDECLGDKKVELLGNELNLKEFDLQNSFFYSDSRSDIPLFLLFGNKIVVKNAQNTDWIDDEFKVLKVDGSYV